MRIYTCPQCLSKNKIGGRVKGRVCKKCGARLDINEQGREPPMTTQINIPEKVSKREIKEQEESKKKEKYSGEFKQFGALCLYCKTVTRFGNKKCQNCKKKLKISPGTTVYYNGIVETVQCRKCGNYTDVKGLKCEHCNKALKF